MCVVRSISDDIFDSGTLSAPGTLNPFGQGAWCSPTEPSDGMDMWARRRERGAHPHVPSRARELYVFMTWRQRWASIQCVLRLVRSSLVERTHVCGADWPRRCTCAVLHTLWPNHLHTHSLSRDVILGGATMMCDGIRQATASSLAREYSELGWYRMRSLSGDHKVLGLKPRRKARTLEGRTIA